MGVRKESCWRLSCWCNEVGPTGCPRPRLIETEEAPDGEDAPVPTGAPWVRRLCGACAFTQHLNGGVEPWSCQWCDSPPEEEAP